MTDFVGTVTDNYTYDAFGEIESQAGVTPNDYLFTGEQFDPTLGFYYLRARYYLPAIGRFQNMDTFGGREASPLSLHKYLYVHANPIDGIDPSGNELAASQVAAIGGLAIISIAAIAYSNQIENVLTSLIDATASTLIPTATSVGQEVRTQKAKDRARAKTEARVLAETGGRGVLFHYTSKVNAGKIRASNCIFATPEVLYDPDLIPRPRGAYATNIPPWITNVTQEVLENILVARPTGRDVSWFVAVSSIDFVYVAGPEYYKPGTGCIPVEIFAIGRNQMWKW